jgi:hypothetical protein
MVASIMGWSPSTTVRMAQHYSHISPDARREAMAAMVAPKIAGPAQPLSGNVTEKIGAIH